MQTVLSPALSRKLANMSLICAFLVVYIHAGLPGEEGSCDWWCAKALVDGICRIAVPFFFVASGFFLAGHTDTPGWWPRELKKRVSSLLVPYLLWELLFAAYTVSLTLIANALAGAEWTRNLSFSIDYWLRVLGIEPRDYPSLVPLWFVRCLMLFMLLAPLPVACLRRVRTWGIMLLIGLWMVSGYYISLNVPEKGAWLCAWKFLLSPSGLFYFTLGLFLRRWPIFLRLPTWGAWGLLLFGLTGTLLSIETQQHGIMVAPHLRWFFVQLMLWATWQLVPSTAWPRALTAMAFPIFLLHDFILATCRPVVKNLPSLAPMIDSFGGFLLLGTIAILGSIAITWGLRQWLPRFAAILFGGR